MCCTACGTSARSFDRRHCLHESTPSPGVSLPLLSSVQRPPQSQVGKLSVRTRPYSDVSHGTRKLGQSPFEIDLPVGSYTLTFKNPAHPTVTRTVKITAGKRAKVIFDLPK